MTTMPSPTSRSGTAALTAMPVASVSAGGFDIAQRGYHRGQVDQWVADALGEIERLGRELAVALQHGGAEVVQAAESPQGRKLMWEVLQVVADEVTGQQQAAQQQIAEMIAGAEQQAAMIIEEARRNADESHRSATAQATSLISNARGDAKRMMDEATARSAAVDEAAGARMAHLAQLHEDGVARVVRVNDLATQMKDVTAKLLAAENERGPLSDEVSRVITQAGIPPRQH
jgi:cell division septum initiation protein DivIVA